MKKLLLLTFCVVLVFLTSYESVSGQPVPNRFDSAYQTYQESLSDYREAFDDYVLARSQYIRFGTLQAEKEARDNTINFLEVRDQVVINFLNILKVKLEEAEGVDESKRTDILARIGDETILFLDHKDSVSSAFTLDELVKDSNEAKLRYVKVEELAYLVATELSIGKVEIYKDRFDEIFEGTKNKLDTIKSDTRGEYQLSDRQRELVDKWVLETETRRNRAEELSLETRENVTKKGYEGSSKRSLSIYNELLGDLSIVARHLDEGGRFIQEIVRIIKTKG